MESLINELESISALGFVFQPHRALKLCLEWFSGFLFYIICIQSAMNLRRNLEKGYC